MIKINSYSFSLPLCGIPTAISFVNEEWNNCVGERASPAPLYRHRRIRDVAGRQVRGHQANILISPLTSILSPQGERNIVEFIF
jgi:hypothetical protein